MVKISKLETASVSGCFQMAFVCGCAETLSSVAISCQRRTLQSIILLAGVAHWHSLCTR